jgi:hypothetical protein
MGIQAFGRRALVVGVAFILLAGCGTSSTGVTVPPATTGASVHRSGSWMLPEAKNDDLLYASNDSRTVYVFSYPSLTQVGELSGINANTQGLCVDKHGDVFVPAWTGSPINGYVFEFAHGGTEPIATLSDPGALNTSCSVDPTTGNLAVTNYGASGSPHGNVAIYQGAQGAPTTYLPPFSPQWAAYDSSGNLFVDGYNAGSSYELAELPSRGSAFTSVPLNKSISMFSLQWNNGYLTIAGEGSDSLEIYRVQISSSGGVIVGATTLRMRRVGYGGNGQYWIQDNRVLGAGQKHRRLDIWRYPRGGNAVETVARNFRPWGVVVSPATKHQNGK